MSLFLITVRLEYNGKYSFNTMLAPKKLAARSINDNLRFVNTFAKTALVPWSFSVTTILSNSETSQINLKNCGVLVWNRNWVGMTLSCRVHFFCTRSFLSSLIGASGRRYFLHTSFQSIEWKLSPIRSSEYSHPYPR